MDILDQEQAILRYIRRKRGQCKGSGQVILDGCLDHCINFAAEYKGLNAA